jgi:arylsulfatase A-like enzyme
VELDTRVPLILAAPGRTDLGLRSRALVELVDIYPTLSELADLPLPEHLEGTSFVPLLQDPDRPWKKAAFSQYPRPAAQTDTGPIMGYSMRTDRYRLTRWVHRDDRQKFVATELYDHASDPDENTNLADDGGSADLVLRLTQQLNGGWRAARPEAPRPAGNDPQGSAHPSPPATAIPRAGGKPSAT